MASERKTRKRALSVDESITSRFKSAIYNIIPPTVSKWFKGMTSSNTNGTVAMADTSDSSSDDEVQDLNGPNAYVPCSEPSAIQTETNNLQDGVNVTNQDETSKGEFASTSNASSLKMSSKEENVWMKTVRVMQSKVSKSVQKDDDSKMQANEYNLKYNPYLRDAVEYAPSYSNCKSGIRGTRNTRNVELAEKIRIEAPLTVYKYNNAATYSSVVIKDLLENVSPPVAEATSKELHKSLGNKNKMKALYVADNAAMINLKRKLSEKERTDISAKRSIQDWPHNLRADTTMEGIAGNNLEADKDSVIVEMDELQAKDPTSSPIDISDEDVLFAFSKPATAISPTSGNILSLQSSIPEIKKNLESSECWASNESHVEQGVCCGNKNSPTIAAQANTQVTNIPAAKGTEVKVNKVTEKIDDTVQEKSSLTSDSIKKILQTQNEKWECTGCLTRNDNSKNNCACCDAEKITKTAADAYRKIIETQNEKWECTVCLTRNDNSKNECACCEAGKSNETNKINSKQLNFGNVPNPTFKFGIDPKEQNDKQDSLPQTKSLINTEMSGETNNNVLPKVPSFKFGIPPQIDENVVIGSKTKNIETPKINFTFGVINQKETNSASTILANNKENKDNENPQEVPKVDLTHVSNAVPVASQAQIQTPTFASSMQNRVYTTTESIQKTSSHIFVPTTIASSTSNIFRNYKPKISPSKSILQQANVDQNSGIKKTPNMSNFTANTNNIGQAANRSFNFGFPVTNISANIQTNNNPVMFDIPVQRENAWPPTHPTDVTTITTRNDLPTATFNRNGSTNRLTDRIPIGNNTQNKNPFESNIQQFKITGFSEPITRFHAPMSPPLDDYGQLNKTESAAPMANIFNSNTFVPQQQPFGMQCQQVRPKFNFGARRSNESVFGFGENESNIRQPVPDNGMWGNFNQGQVAPANSLQFNMGTGTANNPPPRRFKRAVRRTQQR